MRFVLTFVAAAVACLAVMGFKPTKGESLEAGASPYTDRAQENPRLNTIIGGSLLLITIIVAFSVKT